jgi:uncharacterized protein (TIGR02452 family)
MFNSIDEDDDEEDEEDDDKVDDKVAEKVDAGQKDNKNKPKILLVNSASQLHKGGGVRNGATAQEESICRKSNLYLALNKVDDIIGYPLFDKTKGIYLPNITIFQK